MNVNNENQHSIVNNLLKDFKNCMLITPCKIKGFDSRPMQIQKIEEDNTIWFLISKDSSAAKQVDYFSYSLLHFVNPNEGKYIVVWSNASLIHDKMTIKDLWTPEFYTWFPEGPYDPSLVAIKVVPHSTEYWQSPKENSTDFIKTALSFFSGHNPESSKGLHAKINLTATKEENMDDFLNLR